MLFINRFILFILIALVALASPASVATSVTSQQWIRDHIEGYEEPFTLTIGGKSLRACPALTIFYSERNYELAWSDGSAPLPRATRLIHALKAASREGLNLADYQLDWIETALNDVLHSKSDAVNASIPETESLVALAEFDVLLSQIFLRYAAHLGGWRVDDPNSMDPEWFIARPFLDLPATLEKAISSDKIEETLFDLLPRHPDYMRLREFLARYRTMANSERWPHIAKGPKLDFRSRGSRVVLLRERLAAEGFLPYSEKEGYFFDANLRQAVRTFQRTHGLKVDGVVGPITLKVLNTPIEDWIRQIETNMERWRWLPRDLGQRHIMVNVAGYDMEVVDGERTIMTMRVVVGKPYLRTPVFSAEMSYLVLNPYWNIPPTIAKKEILPALRKDPEYLIRHDMEVSLRTRSRREVIDPETIDWNQVSARNFPYRLRQRPGPKNPLGTIKFMLPNRFDIYLHDTSQRSLFSRTERVFSHGCIRVEKPIELMEYILGPKSRWNRGTLKNLNRQRERILGIPKPIPVHILYWTAWVDNDGMIQFRKDIYGRDKLLEASRIAPSNSSSATEKWVNSPDAKRS